VKLQTNYSEFSDEDILKILKEVRVIAMVGASPSERRPSYFVLKYLLQKGFEVIPVNPRITNQKIAGQLVYKTLADIPVRVDMVNIFRKSQAAGQYCDQAIEIGAKVVWMQLGVRNEDGATRARKAGLSVIMDRCPKIEYGRFSGEANWYGYNTRRITARAEILKPKTRV